MPRLLALPLFAVLCAAAHSETIYVDPAAPGPARDGYTWATAYAGIAEAVRVAQPEDMVAVAQGSYAEEIVLKPGVWLRGGYGGFADPSAPPDVNARPSIVSGLGIGPVIYADSTANGAIVEGLHLVPGDYNATAIFCNQSSPTIRGNVIRQAGFAVSCGAGAEPLVNRNVITGCTFGIYCSGSSPTLSGNLVTLCEYAIHTGKLSSPFIVNNTLADNVTGLDVFTGAPDARNNIVARNEIGAYASGGALLLSHNCISGNTTDFDGVADPNGVDGNIAADPDFAAPSSGNYRLGPLSPCRDAGDDSQSAIPSTDLDGRPRIQGPHVDMGAYESSAPPSAMNALRIAAGLRVATTEDAEAMDIIPPAGIDIVDSVRMNRR